MTEATAITDICYDCLERIFDFLDLKSLLCCAQSCKHLQMAAAAKFGHDFGKKTVFLEASYDKERLRLYNNNIS